MTGIPLPESARELLESDAIAHVVTLDEDGAPQVTAAWVGLDGEEIVPATLPEQRKLRNLRRDPRIALSVPSTATNEGGLLEYLVVYGTARVTEGGAPEVLQRLAHRTSAPTRCSRTCPILRRGSSPGSRPIGSVASDRGTRRAARERGPSRSRSTSVRRRERRRSEHLAGGIDGLDGEDVPMRVVSARRTRAPVGGLAEAVHLRRPAPGHRALFDARR